LLYHFLLPVIAKTIIKIINITAVPIYSKKLLSGSGKKNKTINPMMEVKYINKFLIAILLIISRCF